MSLCMAVSDQERVIVARVRYCTLYQLHTSTVLGYDKDRLATVPYNVRFSSDKSFLRSHFASRYGTRLCNYHHSATCKIRDRAFDSL